MKFLVFIKQVPEANEIRFDNARRTLVRGGVKNIINPFDRRAISEAVRVRNEKGGEVVVATMGPPQARDVLTEAIIMGADRGVHIEDTRLAGSDSLVTANVLATAARHIGFDVIFCGQSSTDSETGQVPPELAEILGVACAPAANHIEYENDFVRVRCETEEGHEVLELPLPAVISSAERLIKPIKTKDANLSSVPAEKITTLRLEDLQLSPADVGQTGSPTWVDAIFEEPVQRKCDIVKDASADQAAQKILVAIRDASRKTHAPIVPSASPKTDRQFWCLLEHQKGKLMGVSMEMLSTCAQLASQHGGTVHAILVSPVLNNEEILLLGSYGANVACHVSAKEWHADEVVAVLCEKIAAVKPHVLLIPATTTGRAIAGRIAARLQLGLTGDCVGMDMDSEGRLIQLKPAFGGNILAAIMSKTYPQMATVRPGALPSFQPRSGHEIPIQHWSVPYNVPLQFRVIERIADSGSEALRMTEADVVICAGMGLGQENVPLAEALADSLSGAICATRRVVDAGWLKRQYQVGLTGKFISPRVYLGLGVSGRFNHTVGIQKAHQVIAINSDPAAEIFKSCDLGIVGNAVDVVRALLKLLSVP